MYGKRQEKVMREKKRKVGEAGIEKVRGDERGGKE